MDAERFDAVVKDLAGRPSRRRVLAGLLGIAGGAVGLTVASREADAARRGFTGPKLWSASTCAPVGDPCASAENCCSLCCVSGGGGPAQCVERGTCF